MRENPEGATKNGGIKLRSGRRLRLEFLGAKTITHTGRLAVREFDERMGLTKLTGELIV
jgi:hypothetical protein